MMENGLLKEVENLKDYQHLTSLKTVGYTELFKYFNSEWDLDFAISEIQKNSRRFAKRQLTWYRGEDNIHWVDYQNAFQESLSLLNNKQIITNQQQEKKLDKLEDISIENELLLQKLH